MQQEEQKQTCRSMLSLDDLDLYLCISRGQLPCTLTRFPSSLFPGLPLVSKAFPCILYSVLSCDSPYPLSHSCIFFLAHSTNILSVYCVCAPLTYLLFALLTRCSDVAFKFTRHSRFSPAPGLFKCVGKNVGEVNPSNHIDKVSWLGLNFQMSFHALLGMRRIRRDDF